MTQNKEMSETKVNLHEELNEAYAKLLRICLLLDLQVCYDDLESRMSYMSWMVDGSDFKSV